MDNAQCTPLIKKPFLSLVNSTSRFYTLHTVPTTRYQVQVPGTSSTYCTFRSTISTYVLESPIDNTKPQPPLKQRCG